MPKSKLQTKEFQTLKVIRPEFSKGWNMLRWGLAFSCALVTSPAFGAAMHMPVSGIDPKSGIEITVESAFDKLPPCGFAPMRLVIDNNSSRDGVWNFYFSSSSTYNNERTYRSKQLGVAVAGKAQRIVEVMVPIMTESGTYAYPRLTTTVAGPGCGGNAQQMWSGMYSGSGGHGGTTAFVAMSDTLGLASWSQLEKECKTASVDLNGTQFDITKVPGDYRGWLGVDTVWMSDTDWNSLDATHRQALLDWLKLGGRLHVCFATGTKLDPLPDLPMGDALVGLGRFERVSAKDAIKFVNTAMGKIRSQSKLPDLLRDSYGAGSTWKLRDGIPPIVVHTGLIMLFVCLFAILIGPVNLFLLARKKKHMHLFWTTPALSIVASLGLALVIILQDGFGGRGNRFAAVFLDPVAHKAFVVQEQVSRSGVLLSRTIPVRDSFFMTPVSTESKAATRGAVVEENRNRSYAADGESLSGDWFSSRTVDGHLIAAVQSSRARVEISAGPNGPVITSGIGATLTEVYYRDVKQNIWHVQNLKTGERREMKESDHGKFTSWWNVVKRPVGGYLNERLGPVVNEDQYFFASVAAPTEQMIPTLPSIRWQENTLLYFGPVAIAGVTP